MAEPVCPYCRMPFDQPGPARVFCTSCGTPHHEDCYQENGGCTVFGCERAPADDPKLQVSQSDLSAVNLPGQTYGQQPYMSPQASAISYQPPMYGSPVGAAASAAAQAYASPGLVYGRSQKSRSTFIVLGIFLGALGIHNFYAGYTGKAVGQLCLSVLTLGYLALVSWIWAIIEICLVTRDSSGLDFN